MDVSANKLGIAGGRLICKILETNRVIKSVNLASNALVGDAQALCPDFSCVAALCRVLRANKTITVLNLSKNMLGGWNQQVLCALYCTHTLRAY
jgi:hypothetical protein